MIDLERFNARLLSFPSHYMRDFDDFWRWKLRSETEGSHILDDDYRNETYNKLCNILPMWQTYRGGYNLHPLETLEDSLDNICNAYNQIRKHSLLDFDRVSQASLELIWDELGRARRAYDVDNARASVLLSGCQNFH